MSRWDLGVQFIAVLSKSLAEIVIYTVKLNNDERIDETPMHIALREAFINTLVHTDYYQSGNIIIELNTEKFVFSNPGTLLVSIQQYYNGGISECRNPSLQKMFMLIGRAEKAGSGVDKIMTGWQKSNLRNPFINVHNNPDRVVLTLPMFGVISQSVLNDLNAIFGDISNLTADELTALSFCLVEDSISNKRLQYVLNLHKYDITSLLKNLCEKNYLYSDNNGRWTIYKLKKVDTSGRKVDTSEKKEKTRFKRSDLESLIMNVCKDDYLKMEEISKRINKSTDYLKNKIFPDMIAKGKLEKKYPYTDNHPDQGYRTKYNIDKEE